MTNERTTKAFTLIEILVVVGIIALLAGILTVSLSLAKKAARMHMTKSTMGMISAGAEMFKNDFGVFPPSDPSNVSNDFQSLGLPTNGVSGTNGLNSGSKIICFLLTGYANDIISSTNTNNDGTPAIGGTFIEDDGNDGFGFRTMARGKVRGPYGGAEAAKTAYTAATPSSGINTSPKVFIDSFKHAILYYRYDIANDKYNQPDNSSVDVEIDDQLKASPCPPSGDFDDKYKNARKDFLIISPGEVDNTFDWKEAVTNASVE